MRAKKIMKSTKKENENIYKKTYKSYRRDRSDRNNTPADPIKNTTKNHETGEITTAVENKVSNKPMKIKNKWIQNLEIDKNPKKIVENKTNAPKKQKGWPKGKPRKKSIIGKNLTVLCILIELRLV